jgi:hypothetical protein
MATLHFRQDLYVNASVIGRADFIIRCSVPVDDDGRFGEPSLDVVTGNGRKVPPSREDVWEAAREAVRQELDRRADFTDQGLEPDPWLEEE